MGLFIQASPGVLYPRRECKLYVWHHDSNSSKESYWSRSFPCHPRIPDLQITVFVFINSMYHSFRNCQALLVVIVNSRWIPLRCHVHLWSWRRQRVWRRIRPDLKEERYSFIFVIHKTIPFVKRMSSVGMSLPIIRLTTINCDGDSETGWNTVTKNRMFRFVHSTIGTNCELFSVWMSSVELKRSKDGLEFLNDIPTSRSVWNFSKETDLTCRPIIIELKDFLFHICFLFHRQN